MKSKLWLSIPFEAQEYGGRANVQTKLAGGQQAESI
jgi:hypothetical protein